MKTADYLEDRDLTGVFIESTEHYVLRNIY